MLQLRAKEGQLEVEEVGPLGQVHFSGVNFVTLQLLAPETMQ